MLIARSAPQGELMKRLIPFPIVFLLACSSPNPLPTPSGKAEIVIQAPKAKVKEALLARALDKGFNIKSDTESSIVIGKRSDSVGLAMLAGSKYDAQPEIRVRYDLVALESGTRVVSTAMVVTNADSAFERITTLEPGAKAYQELQSAMNEVKSKVETSQANK